MYGFLRSRTSAPRRSVPLLLVGVLAGLALALTACSGSSSGGSDSAGASASATGYRGAVLPTPITLTASTAATAFSSTAGGTSTLSSLGQNGLLLLYFGYTNCPDVCPTTMADIGQALQSSPKTVQAKTQVVFVTSDPARDTVPVMTKWLANFDVGLAKPFVGLTSSIATIDAAAKSVGVPLEPPVTNPDGSVTVQHGAQVLAFDNGKASVVWLAGTSAADYSHDIAQLLVSGS